MFIDNREPGKLCALCSKWLKIPGQIQYGLCPYLKFPHNRTHEMTPCRLGINLETPLTSGGGLSAADKQ